MSNIVEFVDQAARMSIDALEIDAFLYHGLYQYDAPVDINIANLIEFIRR